MSGFWESDRGGLAIAFAVVLPVLVASVGASVDFAQIYLVRERLSGALDAAALAAAASTSDPDAIEARVSEFFDANYPEDRIGLTYDLEVSVTDNEVHVSAAADYSTVFLRIVGVDTVTVRRETTVQRETMGLEVVLVLDNTGSMRTGGKIAALRAASRNFVDVLFDSAEDPEHVKIGLVPYADTVNIGSYGLGFTPDGEVYDGGQPFVVLPEGWQWDPGSAQYTISRQKWMGCVIAYNEDGWQRDFFDNDPYPYDTIDHEGPWEPYLYEELRRRDGQIEVDDSHPNAHCTPLQVLPLTSDQDKLTRIINSMAPGGGTVGNYGMVWGYRLISPEFPFTEGADWDDHTWKKIVVMMTDGENSVGFYNAYWLSNHNSIRVQQLDERFLEVCENMKEAGIQIYTITFSADAEGARDLYRDCASSPDFYYHAPSQRDLIDVFEEIARSLSNLHISR
ncbi:MAG: hypothetical protein KDJ15_00200 [Alphaproteobacteria bacterium]|nr:hypothetical protein [Alphaproteobacteria bacterium]